MTIRYTCEDCGSLLKIEDTLAGTEGRCPKCRAAFTVPQPSGSKLLAVASGGTAPSSDAAGPVADGSPSSDEDIATAFLMDEASTRSGDGEPGPAAERPIRYTCSTCGSHLTIRPDRAGTEGRCPKCKARFTVPTPRESGDDAAAADSKSAADTTEPPEGSRQPEKDHRRSLRKSDEAPVSAAEVASRFLKENARAESEAQSAPGYEPARRKRPKDKDKEGFDWAGMSKYFARTVLPGLAGIVVLSMGLYWVASAVIKGSPERPPLGRVTGTVTLDGEPLAGALVTFRPQMEKVGEIFVSESVGWTDASGRYSLVYVHDVDGAAVGEHRVEINATDARGAEILAPVHHAKSTRIVNVEPGSNTFDFQLDSTP